MFFVSFCCMYTYMIYMFMGILGSLVLKGFNPYSYHISILVGHIRIAKGGCAVCYKNVSLFDVIAFLQWYHHLAITTKHWGHFSRPSMAPLSAVSVDTRFTIGLRALASWTEMGCKACEIHWWNNFPMKLPVWGYPIFRFVQTHLGFPETNRWQPTILRDTSLQHVEKSIETTHVGVQESQMFVTRKPTTLLLMHSMPFFWYLVTQTPVSKVTKAPRPQILKTGTTWRALVLLGDLSDKWWKMVPT